MFHLSVRAKTTIISVVAFAVAIVVAAAALIITLRTSLLDEIDRSIDSRAADIAAQVDSENELIVLGAGIESDTLAVVFSLDGALFDSTDFSVDLDALADSFDQTDTPFNVDLSPLSNTVDANNLRAVVLDVPLDPISAGEEILPEDFLIYVATSLDGFDRTVGRVTLVATISTPVLIAIVGLLTWFMTGRALAPVAAIREEVDAITDTELERRVPEPKTNDEVAKLATTMNAMLGRLELAQRSQHQFVADASHELRSPLAAMASRLDVAERHGSAGEWRDVATQLRADVTRMHGLVEDLLLLAKSNARSAAPQTLVDLDDVVLNVVRELPSNETVRVDTSGVSAGLIRGDRQQLRRLVTNLVTNAVRHADELVEIRVSEKAGAVVFTVDDDGSGIDPGDRDRIFDRFIRLDDARDRDSGGSGLGLAISREIVSRHGGTIVAGASPAGGARLTTTLPSPI